ncbi:hypothetical protein KDN32_03685 [Nocardioides sp. J2M5]|uniref:DUF6542 domain-containing protein n=1 Tax=Nocardioides palaemonis TaxID=2829810 RepID=UPI001BA9FD52|nr:DUF6542 domain-containing protein [Nocardioides palaemonis]MBS2936843.1 hypothetical protein [Nocardioides palaemonis]
MTHAEPYWQAGQEPGRQVVALGVAVILTAVAVDVLLVGRLTIFFDLCFTAACLLLATLVRRRDFLLVAFLPPLLMTVVVAFLALVARDVVADPADSLLQAVVSGVATHGVALGAGYALCLAWLGWRLHRGGNLVAELSRELT